MPSDPKTIQDRRSKERHLAAVLESVTESVDAAESLITDFSEAEFGDMQHEIRVAVREGMVNAILHGNRFDSAKKVFLRAEMDARRLLISIRDEGDGYDPDSVPDPSGAANVRGESGRGMFLMKACMDDVSWQRVAGGGTELVMAKRRSGQQGETA
jgi:serine/threonine-protein kinase RsbW